MSEKPYYYAYEERYRQVFAAGAELWGHAPDDEALVTMLTKWVDDNHLQGKRVIEFACGEGASGVILSRLGCRYHGVDLAPSAVEKAKTALQSFPQASISQLDMVREAIGDTYNAALDVMGFHMLVTDADRSGYLRNAYNSLNPGAPMLFYRQSYRADAYEGKVDSFAAWTSITGMDYETPQPRKAKSGDTEVDVSIPLVAARARNREGYTKELEDVGFVVDVLIEMNFSDQQDCSSAIFVHKPA